MCGVTASRYDEHFLAPTATLRPQMYTNIAPNGLWQSHSPLSVSSLTPNDVYRSRVPSALEIMLIGSYCFLASLNSGISMSALSFPHLVHFLLRRCGSSILDLRSEVTSNSRKIILKTKRSRKNISQAPGWKRYFQPPDPVTSENQVKHGHWLAVDSSQILRFTPPRGTGYPGVNQVGIVSWW